MLPPSWLHPNIGLLPEVIVPVFIEFTGWGLKKKDKRKLNTTEMRMLRMILGVTLKDKLRNEEVRRRTTVTTSVVTIVERSIPHWYGHLLRKNEEEVVRQVWEEAIKEKEVEDES